MLATKELGPGAIILGDQGNGFGAYKTGTKDFLATSTGGIFRALAKYNLGLTLKVLQTQWHRGHQEKSKEAFLDSS